MKATTWLCPVLTLLCASRLVCTAQRGVYPLDYADSNLIQDDYLLDKRNKPSLSIVNPLDVLRQRLLLEIARRQMKENTRQVELNRAILKNVGKRLSLPATRRYQMSLEQQQQQQQQQLQQLLPHFAMAMPLALEYVPNRSIFDYLQRPAFHMPENSDNDNNDDSDDNDQPESNLSANLNLNLNSLDNALVKHRQHQQQRNSGGGGGGGGNEIGNDSSLPQEHASSVTAASLLAGNAHGGNGNNSGGGGTGDTGSNTDGHLQQQSNGARGLANLALLGDNGNVLTAETHPDYQLRYLYRLHENHFAQK